VLPKYDPNLIAGGMLRINTPIEHYPELGLYVKREDLSCPPPGPPFSKARGVYAWVKKQESELIGVLDTVHSQGGHAVARACQILGKFCLNFYPEFKYQPGPKEPQLRARELGAKLFGLPAGRSAILYHAAKKQTESHGGIIIPNALKLTESVEETAKEVPSEAFDTVIIPASSGTIAAGVIRGFVEKFPRKAGLPRFVVHLGYSRSTKEVRKYLGDASECSAAETAEIIDEGYAYKDVARSGPTPPWACNEFYDLKSFRWYMANRERFSGKVLFWLIG
jgi:hypothetical protein